MRYQQANRGDLVQANEYWNTDTEEFEAVEKHGLYDIQETLLTPAGEVLFLAYNANSGHPFAVGILTPATPCTGPTRMPHDGRSPGRSPGRSA